MAEILVTELSNEYGARTGFLLMAHDVSARHEAEHQLQHMALHDALTSLPNRNMLQEQLKACLNIAQREKGCLALMFIDLDRFKKINDSLGHHIGDSVLIEISRRLRSAMRTSDIVARLGGDEFVVLLPRIQAQADGELVAAKVHEVFNAPVRSANMSCASPPASVWPCTPSTAPTRDADAPCRSGHVPGQERWAQPHPDLQRAHGLALGRHPAAGKRALPRPRA